MERTAALTGTSCVALGCRRRARSLPPSQQRSYRTRYVINLGLRAQGGAADSGSSGGGMRLPSPADERISSARVKAENLQFSRATVVENK